MRRSTAAVLPKTLALAVIGVSVGTGASGCGLLGDLLGGHKSAVEAIAGQLKSMPGISSVDLGYTNNISSGEQIRLTAEVASSATPEQAGAAARMFAEQGLHRRLDRANSAELALTYPLGLTRPNYYLRSDSSANISVESGLDGMLVADTVATWLSAARAPIVESVLTTPTWGETDSFDTTVALRPETTAAQAEALQQQLPGLSDATWEINAFDEPNTRPNIFRTNPGPPTAKVLTLWQQVSDAVAPYGHVSGVSNGPGQRVPGTSVEVELPTGRGAEPDQQRIAHAVAALLSQFGQPVTLESHAGAGPIEVQIGGCFQHEPQHRRLALELELAAQYEKC
ncbi:hypothetical protein [Mycolicibacterium lutetiense]|uniref:Uncharacterized protein n=1 Tax=Mycolicibacterium lutetiense TaxID=1641992 RepID=A0ABS4ZTY8_9MYCO|nr:hypothetical protein [Mycolicibacterium lutetiense]MBP2452987.1 hypothetical protein [Mycolicibacterium lutetiense]